jgi:hypothetical protein
MPGIEHEDVPEHGKSGFEPVHAAQGVGRMPEQLHTVKACRRIIGQGQDVSRPSVQLGNVHPGLPVRKDLAEIFGAGRLNAAPVHWSKADELLIDGTAYRLGIDVERIVQLLSQPLGFTGERLRPRVGLLHPLRKEQLAVVVERAIRRNIERSCRPAPVDHEDATRRDPVAHAKLVEDVRIQYGNVCDDDIGGHELVEHVRPDVAGTGFVVGSERHAPGALERGLDELRVDDIEINADGVGCGTSLRRRNRGPNFLGAKRHDDECTCLHEEAEPFQRI